MPPPQLSIVLLDPPRFARQLAELQRVAGFREGGRRGEPLGLRAFAREIGISAPALLLQMRGERRHLRKRTLDGIHRLQDGLRSWVRSDVRLQRFEALLLGGHSYMDCVVELGSREDLWLELEHANDAWAMESLIADARKAFDACALETWVLPNNIHWRAEWDRRPHVPTAPARRFKTSQVAKEWARLAHALFDAYEGQTPRPPELSRVGTR